MDGNEDQVFAAVIAAVYFKVFGREMAMEDVEVFKENKMGIAVVGALPAEFLKFFGELFPTKYWKMASLWRRLILEDDEVLTVSASRCCRDVLGSPMECTRDCGSFNLNE